MMEDEIEDLVGEVKYTNSQKSISTTYVYSVDCNDSSSNKNNSSSKETYVLEYDSEDSDEAFQLNNFDSIIDVRSNQIRTSKNIPASHCIQASNEIQSSDYIQSSDSIQSSDYMRTKIETKSASTSLQHYLIPNENYTQTSKTIIQLAEKDGYVQQTEQKTLETQTSFASMMQNDTIEITLRLTEHNNNKVVGMKNFTHIDQLNTSHCNIASSHKHLTLKEDEFSKLQNITIHVMESELETNSVGSGSSKGQNLIKDNSKVNRVDYDSDENNDSHDGDIDPVALEENSFEYEDSLMGSGSNSLDNYFDNPNEAKQEMKSDVPENHEKDDQRRFEMMTPLTEESIGKDMLDIPFDIPDMSGSPPADERNEVLFKSQGMNIKLLKDDCKKTFKLPHIKNKSCPSSPHLNSLFNKQLNKSDTLPCLFEKKKENRWEIENKNLASGESADRNQVPTKSPPVHLPPIFGDSIQTVCRMETEFDHPLEHVEPISIKNNIQLLKLGAKRTRIPLPPVNSRSRSVSPDENILYDVADRGCEALCVELLRRLQPNNDWHDVMLTLDEIPRVLEKFWGILSENRIASLLRQVCAYVESPRPQVGRSACATAAALIKNTNYTKKPDYYEAITILLNKTGSFSQPLRRAANVALDEIVCGVDMCHAVSSLCIHGISHKNPLVRCAAARLLVVSCALARGGRMLLRTKPASTVAARRLALRALSSLLSDRSTETRKYAERLYSMLRPLPNFEAFYLTDVDTEMSSKQMQKYDKLLPPILSSDSR